MVPEIRSAKATPHPLGNRIDVNWSVTVATVPTAYRTIVFRSRGSAVSSGAIAAWFAAGTMPTDAQVHVFDSAFTEASVPPNPLTFYVADSETRIVYDQNCANGSVYYYSIVVQDTTTTSDRSATVTVSATPAFTSAVKTFDVKNLLLLYLKRILRNIGGMSIDSNVFVVESFSDVEEHDPQIGVFRMASTEARRFLGSLRDAEATSDTFAEYLPEVFGVVWQSKSPKHVDALYLIFQASAPSLKKSFVDAGASECYVQFGAESVVQDSDGKVGRRGRMTVVVEHDLTRINIERIQGRPGVDFAVSPTEDTP